MKHLLALTLMTFILVVIGLKNLTAQTMGRFFMFNGVSKEMKEKGLSMEGYGTGIYKVPDPSKSAKGNRNYRAVYVKHITLTEAKLRGKNVEEFSWIPESLYSFEVVSHPKKADGCGACNSSSDCDFLTCMFCYGSFGCSP